MLANDLLDRLERLGLLDQEIIEALREQLSQSGARVTPEKIAQLLVENGQLTRFQATKLIGELRNEEYPQDAVEADVVEAEAVDDLGLADGVVEAEAVADEAEEVVEAEAIEEAQPVYAEAVAVEDSIDAAMGGARRSSGGGPKKVNVTKKKRDETKSVWDSFKIYGVAGIVVLLSLFGGLLYFVLSKGNADDFIARANTTYDQQNYLAAEKEFTSFLESFGESNPHSSVARTRLTMSKLYQISQYTDPVKAVDASEELLPTIENEEGLDDERNNLAALLVTIAGNIAKEAQNVPETTEKQRLLGELDRQIRMTENPMYVTASARQSLSAQLLGIAESRARVQRDIDRNLRLDESVAAMEKALANKETKEAYDIRMTLLREFPELRTNPRIVELVQSASGIQQTLVKTATRLPKVELTDLASDAVKNVVLTNRTAGQAPGLSDEIIYVRAHGSILAFAAADGKMLWRRYVGYGQSHEPVSIDEGGRAGVLLSDADELEIKRSEATSGNVLWRAAIGEPFSQPVSYRDEIYVSTESGRVISIDAETGDARWATEIPQPLEQSPGMNDRLGRLYLPGNHSNLYVLDKRNGKCIESYYLGHAPGTVAVPPIALQGGDGGHVFVFENAGADYTLMHVLKVDQAGEKLTVAQQPFRLVGNVTVPPTMVLGRRLIVLTDRAQIAVYDIEQTAATAEQVSLVAEQVASYDAPTNAQMAVGKNQVWITGTRIGRYELQVSTGRVAREWVINEGDSFIGRPQVIQDTLFHARVLRGTSGVRVTAADPKSGNPYWQTDVGVPVSMITPAPGGKSFHVVTAQAALFELDAAALNDGATTAPIENPGGTGVAMRFEDPAVVDKDRAVMLNQESGSQLSVYDATREREKLRLITLSLPDGKPSGSGLIAGSGFLLPLDSGRIVLMNWQTGSQLGSPFQPPSSPNTKVKWSMPVTLPSDPDQVIVADDRKKIYRLRVGEQVRELASETLEAPLLGTCAIIGDTMYATSAGPSADFLLSFDAGSLAEKSKRLMDGRVVWGPIAVGEYVLLRTDDGKLRSFDTAGEPKFEIALPDGPMVDGITQTAESLIVCGRDGWVVSIDPAAGTMIGQTDLSQPLSAPPLPVGKRLLVPGMEGVVYIIETPQSVPSL
jgi:outer membrane protein assembly factor BamB